MSNPRLLILGPLHPCATLWAAEASGSQQRGTYAAWVAVVDDDGLLADAARAVPWLLAVVVHGDLNRQGGCMAATACADQQQGKEDGRGRMQLQRRQLTMAAAAYCHAGCGRLQPRCRVLAPAHGVRQLHG